MTAPCGSARFVPTKEEPTGSCGQPATRAVLLGQTGRHLAVCPDCSERYGALVDLAEVAEP